jgi:hypothetical protein
LAARYSYALLLHIHSLHVFNGHQVRKPTTINDNETKRLMNDAQRTTPK